MIARDRPKQKAQAQGLRQNFTLYLQNNKSSRVIRQTFELYFSREISKIVQKPSQNPLDKNFEPEK